MKVVERVVTNKVVTNKEKRAEERVEEAKKTLARAICRVEDATDMLEFECRENGWEEEVCFVIREGLEKLGEALATLTVWDENTRE